jgi:hypothetical protein
MKKLKLSLPQKTQEIGDSINKINSSFSTLKSYLRQLREVKNEGESLITAIKVWSDDLTYCLNFMNRNNTKYLNLFEEVLNKKDVLIKPLILMYPSKIRSDVGAYSRLYIQNLVHDWITRFYPIQVPRVGKPNYVEGQKAVIYYLRNEETSLTRTTTARDSTICVTRDTSVTARCTSTRVGQVCINGCGCVSCAGTKHCNKTERIDCYFTDNNARRERVQRYLALNMKYEHRDFPETKFGFVRFIVEDCIWKVDNTVPITTPLPDATDVTKGVVTLKENKQIVTFDRLSVQPF